MGGWHVVEYGFNAELRGMEQILPFQDKDRVEGCLRHQAPPYALGAWLPSEPVKPGHEASFNKCFHKPHPMQVMGKETEGLLGKIVDGRQPSMAVRMGGG